MSPKQVHVINHTHWDREWFLTSVYTSRWIPGLIDRLAALMAANPDFRYLLDGQTLIIEDLLAVAPAYEQQVVPLIRSGRLQIGPYYCQPDWQLTHGELLVRNLQYGLADSCRYGGSDGVGWLVDTFGHTSQAAQIHQLFDIDAVFVWRGVPQLTPYFHWQALDNSQVLAVNLFGGYRNLYGVTHAPEVARQRLENEVQRLAPYYPTADIPLFDGYDLEDDPEDPLSFFASQEDFAAELRLQESTPVAFADHIAGKELDLPTIKGELNSGKYGATFPGTFSARTYLKVMAYDCAHLLLQRCEPLAVMAAYHGRPYPAEQFEKWSRQLLQNAVHDCICGVSIDLVHVKMEYSYRQLFAACRQEMEGALEALLSHFPAGDYAVSTNSFPVDQWQAAGDEWVHVRTDGVGVWPIRERLPVEQTNRPENRFTWENDYFVAVLGPDGVLRVGPAAVGQFVVRAEKGDTYSAEPGEVLGELRPTLPMVVTGQSERHATVQFNAEWQQADLDVQLTVHLHFDQSPMIKWQIDLDSRGTDFSVEMVFNTARPGEVLAGMPFDIVRRPVADTDLLPRELPDDLASILLGQRELGETTIFPFHDFVAVTDETSSLAILARGLHAYSTDATGTIRLPLRRAVEWLTCADLPGRVGDAGPFFYVPGARGERLVQHEVALLVGDFPAGSPQMAQYNAAYHNPPLLVRGEGEGSRQEWQLFREDLPLSSLTIPAGKPVARLYNPTAQPHQLTRAYTQVDVWGEALPPLAEVPAYKIISVRLPEEVAGGEVKATPVEWLSPPVWRVGMDQGRPDPAILDEIEEKIKGLEIDLAAVETALKNAEGAEALRLQHRRYVLAREQLEYRLTHLLGRRALAGSGELDEATLYQPDPEIARLGLDLNKMRIKRRIFDYVVQAI